MGTFTPYDVPGIQTDADGRRYPHGSNPDAYSPRYLCLAYVRFEPAGLVVRHAYFPMTRDLQPFAAAEFSWVASTGQWKTNPIRSEMNFENFTFGSQQLIVFHVDPAGAAARFDPDNLVQFAEWSARGPKSESSRKARNNCFLNPAVATWSGLEVLTLENWYVDEKGSPIAPPLQLYYTMNVHLLMPCAAPAGDDGMSDVPLILDPDTGNMGSQP